MPGPFCPGAEYTLPPEEAAHLRARRIRTGAQVTIFDGTGISAQAVLSSQTTVTVLATTSAETPAKSVSVIIALPKSSSRADWIVEKLVELGVARLIWAHTSRVVAAAPKQARFDRWARLSISASKQCMRSDVPPVQYISTWGEMLNCASKSELVILLSACGAPVLGPVCKEAVRVASKIAVLVGPEGGFTQSEEKQIEALGALKVCLGPNRLRVDTASFSIAAALMQMTHLISQESAGVTALDTESVR